MKPPSLLPLPALSWSCLLVFGALASAAAAATSPCVATAFALVPACAQGCVLGGAASVGCASTDFGCQCQKTAALFAAVDGCVSLACPAQSYQAVIDGMELGECACFSVYCLGGYMVGAITTDRSWGAKNTVCECVAPVVLRRQGGTASVSGTVVGSATATATVSATATVQLSTTAATTATATTDGSGQGNGATWTGYSSVSNVATASAVGAAPARPTPMGASNVVGYVAMAGAALLL